MYMLLKSKAMSLGMIIIPPRTTDYLKKILSVMYESLPVELLAMGIQEIHKTTETLAMAPGYLPEFEGKMPCLSDTGLEGIQLSLTWEEPS